MCFDLSKAFDSLPHSLILSRVGVIESLLDWFESYLTGRLQRVVLNGSISPTVSVTSGVPQGSSPLLFSLCVDPLSQISISNTGVIVMFADDIVFYKPVFHSEDLTALQTDCAHRM